MYRVANPDSSRHCRLTEALMLTARPCEPRSDSIPKREKAANLSVAALPLEKARKPASGFLAVSRLPVLVGCFAKGALLCCKETPPKFGEFGPLKHRHLLGGVHATSLIACPGVAWLPLCYGLYQDRRGRATSPNPLPGYA